MSSLSPLELRIAPDALGVILRAHASAESQEPCGLLVGHEEGRSIQVVEAAITTNEHPQADRAFRVPASEHAVVQREARKRGLRVVGSWHGHLRGRAEMGAQDHAGLAAAVALVGPHAMLIVGRGAGSAPVVRAFVHSEDGVVEARVGTWTSRPHP